ncbi:hypothetical protein [Paracoccus rhizosphaerae]|uniref:Uncharacterized protein n=1 Tax=Paracoccus rhizosphaerae TaxID=1133347 RepID=A0ABV6CTH1_9RHOB|nr:hypothetical protein [Paracoccus rhizosphaerae]
MPTTVTTEMLLECLEGMERRFQDMERRFCKLEAELETTAFDARALNKEMVSFLQARKQGE